MDGAYFNIFTLTVPTLQLLYYATYLGYISTGVNTIIKDN